MKVCEMSSTISISFASTVSFVVQSVRADSTIGLVSVDADPTDALV